MQMLIKISRLMPNHLLFWKIIGFVSSIVAFTSFALSPSFHDLFGSWNLLKIAIYSVTSSILTTLMLLIKKCNRFTRSVLVKAHVGFLVMMFTSLCSIWQDRVDQKQNLENGSRGRILDMCAFGALGLMSLSLSRQLRLGFEVGIFNFSLGSFLVLLMKMTCKLAPLAAIWCYVIINIRSFSEYFMEKLAHVGSSDRALEEVIIDLQPMNVPEHSVHNGISGTHEGDTSYIDTLERPWAIVESGSRTIHLWPMSTDLFHAFLRSVTPYYIDTLERPRAILERGSRTIQLWPMSTNQFHALHSVTLINIQSLIGGCRLSPFIRGMDIHVGDEHDLEVGANSLTLRRKYMSWNSFRDRFFSETKNKRD